MKFGVISSSLLIFQFMNPFLFNTLLWMSFYNFLFSSPQNCRRLSILRENFSSSTLNFSKYNVPLMALTATATVQVREDILKSLCMSKETKIILTSFFRPNLRFSVSTIFPFLETYPFFHSNSN